MTNHYLTSNPNSVRVEKPCSRVLTKDSKQRDRARKPTKERNMGSKKMINQKEDQTSRKREQRLEGQIDNK